MCPLFIFSVRGADVALSKPFRLSYTLPSLLANGLYLAGFANTLLHGHSDQTYFDVPSNE